MPDSLFPQQAGQNARSVALSLGDAELLRGQSGDNSGDLALRHGGWTGCSAGVCPLDAGVVPRASRFGHVRQPDPVARQVLVEVAETTLVARTAGSPASVWTRRFTYVMWTRCCSGSTGAPSRAQGSATARSAATWLLRGLFPADRHELHRHRRTRVAATPLCSGNTGSARGAASPAAEALTTARAVPTMGGTLIQMAEIRSR
jgi:hypothetical protein